jgi:hypothetical protein
MQARPSASTSLMAWGIVSGYPAMLHGFKVQAGPIHVRILRPFFWCCRANRRVSFMLCPLELAHRFGSSLVNLYLRPAH